MPLSPRTVSLLVVLSTCACTRSVALVVSVDGGSAEDGNAPDRGGGRPDSVAAGDSAATADAGPKDVGSVIVTPPGPEVVSNQTLTGLLVMGYQGWFTYPGAPAEVDRWVHWSKDSATPGPDNVRVEMWPDLSEFAPSELRDTRFTFADGRKAALFSSAVPATVDRHMRWAKEYGIDGVFLQRFLVSVADNRMQRAFRNKVAQNVLEATKKHGRVFAIEYDVSGAKEATLVTSLKDDWRYLVNTLGLTASDRYLRHRGRPLLVLWGLGFDDNPGTAAQANELIDWFTRDAPEAERVTLAGGLPTRWRTQGSGSKPEPEWAGVYRRFAVIHPWMVGRYRDDEGIDSFRTRTLLPDLEETRKLGIDFLPVVFPGFSWSNNKYAGDPAYLNQTPRRGGAFWWKQFHSFMSAGCDMVFGAMFDEVDEGTAMFKIATTKADVPAQGAFLTLDADGLKMSSDFYLRLAGAGARVVHKETPLTPTVPIPLLP